MIKEKNNGSVLNIIFPCLHLSLSCIQIKPTILIFRKCCQLCLCWKQKQLSANEKNISTFSAQCWMSCEGSLSHFKRILKRVMLHKQEGITTRFCCWLHDVTKLCPQYDFWDTSCCRCHHRPSLMLIFYFRISEAKGSDEPAGRLAGPLRAARADALFCCYSPLVRIELRRSDKNAAVAMELWCR